MSDRWTLADECDHEWVGDGERDDDPDAQVCSKCGCVVIAPPRP